MTSHNSLSRPFCYTPPLDDLDVVYADDALLVLNKPSGLLSVPGKAIEHKDCLESRARLRFPEALTVHRLDMDTSGLIVMGLGKAAHRYLSIGFEKRRPEKSYIACVWGKLEENSGLIDLPLACDWPNRPLQKVDFDRGKPSVTQWQLMRYEAGAQGVVSRVKLHPKTGRSHQLRVHMLALGHPIMGDRFYAGDRAWQAVDRLQLHASDLTINHPEDDRKMSFVAPCPF